MPAAAIGRAARPVHARALQAAFVPARDAKALVDANALLAHLSDARSARTSTSVVAAVPAGAVGLAAHTEHTGFERRRAAARVHAAGTATTVFAALQPEALRLAARSVIEADVVEPVATAIDVRSAVAAAAVRAADLSVALRHTYIIKHITNINTDNIFHLLAHINCGTIRRQSIAFN